MPKINQEEYEVLKELDDKWKWIARDEDGDLYAFDREPQKIKRMWFDENGDAGHLYEHESKFQFIQWEDEEPYSIAELIEEYEEEVDLKEQISVVMDRLEEVCGIAMKEVGRVFGGIGLESEETEVKSIQDLIDKWENYKNVARTVANPKAIEHADMFISDLNQLDEPEITELDALNRLAENVQFSADEIASHLEKLSAYNGEVTYGEQGTLSQKWIDEHKEFVGKRPDGTRVEVVREKYLQNLLVPKQELPVIPQWVADWIEHNKKTGSIHQATNLNSIHTEIHFKEIYANQSIELQELIARAWLDGYEVAEEREQKYYVDLDTAAYVAKWDGDGSVQIYTDSVSGSDEYELHLTEQEIKDYDPRFWPFAVPVEDVEE